MFKTKLIARAGIISALYIAVSLLTLPLASGVVQVRIAEGLTLLPLFFVEAIPAVFVGCIIVNVITACAFWDVVLGSLITLTAAICTYFVGRIIKNTPLKIIVGGIFPVLLNALLLPLIWILLSMGIEEVYYVSAIYIFVGQAISVYGAGSLIVLGTRKLIKKQE